MTIGWKDFNEKKPNQNTLALYLKRKVFYESIKTAIAKARI